MRSLLAKEFNERVVEPNEDHERITRLFGSSKKGNIKRSRLLFSDMVLKNEEELRDAGLQSMTEVKFENSISRATAVANPRPVSYTHLIDEMKAKRGVKQDVELTAEDLHELAEQFKAEYKAKIGADFPTDPKEQLMGAIKAVFRSWDNPRANVYRRDNDIPYSWGRCV